MLAGAVYSALGVAPLFLLSGLAVQVGADLGFGVTGLGVLTAAYFSVGSLASVAGGRWCQARGPNPTMRASAAMSGVSMGVLAVGARSFLSVLGIMAVAGLANAFVQPATSLYLTRATTPDRQGLAFGVKQASVPAASLMGGLAVPLAANTFGWRSAFLVGAGVAVVVASIGPPSISTVSTPQHTTRREPMGRRPLVMLTVASGLGTAGASSLAVFLATAGVEVGLTETRAALVVTVSSIGGIVVRLGVGVRADRRGSGHLRTVAWMMLTGSVGFGALVLDRPLVFIVTAPVVFALGWGWAGLFMLSIVRLNPDAAGAAIGVTQTGMMAGSVIGPTAFGFVAGSVSFAAAWFLAGMALCAAGLIVLVTRRRI